MLGEINWRPRNSAAFPIRLPFWNCTPRPMVLPTCCFQQRHLHLRGATGAGCSSA